MDERTAIITFHGPEAADGPPGVAVVLPVVEAFGDALRLMIRHQHDVVAGHRPAYPPLLSASALRLAGVSAEPCSVALELAPAAALGKLEDAPLDGLGALLNDANADVHGLPREVGFPLRQIVAGLPEGINAVTIGGPVGLPTLKLTRELFDDGPVQTENLSHHGRLWEVDWRRGTAVLRGWHDVCILVFPKTMAETMCSVAGRLVSVAGQGERTPDGFTIIRKIDAINVQPLDNGLPKAGAFDIIEPFEEDIQQALAMARWEEKQRECFYDDELDAWADELLKDALEK